MAAEMAESAFIWTEGLPVSNYVTGLSIFYFLLEQQAQSGYFSDTPRKTKIVSLPKCEIKIFMRKMH